MRFSIQNADPATTAFAVRLRVLCSRPCGAPGNDSRVPYVLYSDNYITLPPGGNRAVELEVEDSAMDAGGCCLFAKGWNTNEVSAKIPAGRCR